MAVFAVHYRYADDADRLAEIRPVHREFLSRLLGDGTLLASGPWASGEVGALLLVVADTPDDALALLDDDPFAHAGLIAERSARQWRPVIGPWSDLA